MTLSNRQEISDRWIKFDYTPLTSYRDRYPKDYDKDNKLKGDNWCPAAHGTNLAAHGTDLAPRTQELTVMV